MRKFILWVVPLILAMVTIILVKPSDEKCRKVAIEKLHAIHIKADTEDILVKDYVILKTIRYKNATDTFKLGSAAFLQVRIKEDRLTEIKAEN
jgi:hypothetical protein